MANNESPAILFMIFLAGCLFKILHLEVALLCVKVKLEVINTVKLRLKAPFAGQMLLSLIVTVNNSIIAFKHGKKSCLESHIFFKSLGSLILSLTYFIVAQEASFEASSNFLKLKMPRLASKIDFRSLKSLYWRLFNIFLKSK